MKRHDLRLAAAKLMSDNQRARLHYRLNATRARLLPSRLKFDATQAVEQRISDTAKLGVDQVKAHPILAGAGVAAIIAWLFRAPLIEHGPDMADRSWNWVAGKLGLSRSRLAETDAADDGVNNNELPPHSPSAPSSDEQTDSEKETHHG